MSVLAAVDGEQAPDDVVRVAADIATQYGDELVVAHVMLPETYEERNSGRNATEFGLTTAGKTGYGPVGSGSPYSVDEAQRDAKGVARDVTEETLDDVPETVTHVGRVGEPVTEVLDLAEEHQPRYLVIGGRRRTPVGKAVFGSSTQSFLLNASLPVVTVLPGEDRNPNRDA